MTTSIGVFKTSLKEDERRVPIYPEHLARIDPEIQKRLFFEDSYGADYGFSDEYFSSRSQGVLSREELFRRCDVLLLPKPLPTDIRQMHEGQTLCGWCHCVQQREITQAAIDRKITVIAWESMNHWDEAGRKLLHIFYKNNEVAGYAAILHVLELLGMDGHYGPRRKVIVMGYGSVSRGAIYALQGRGFNNIHVYTRRPTHLVADQNPDVYYYQYKVEPDGAVFAKDADGRWRPFIDELASADVICNGVLQDTDDPTMFVRDNDLPRLKPRCVIVDISCDERMGFFFARPTSFESPTFLVGEQITYYSVDHTPTYLWNAASREISRALIPYLPELVKGPAAWQRNETLRRAIEIENGVVLNKKILAFQKREESYPHLALVAGRCAIGRIG
jgi:N5-(carboxyethyl)ornithine synthase